MTFRTMLSLKSTVTAVLFKYANEAYYTQTCSESGSHHNRDANAANNGVEPNILAAGNCSLAVTISGD